MLLHAQPLLFEFEHQASENLSYIPMCVRFNLDRCAQRLSLAQWQALPHAVRVRLACYPLAAADRDASAFAQALSAGVGQAGAGQLEPVGQAPDLAWAHTDAVPAALQQQCALHGLAAISLADWARRTAFQRYVLLKLSRRATANHDFLAAWREFELCQDPSAPFIGDHH